MQLRELKRLARPLSILAGCLLVIGVGFACLHYYIDHESQRKQLAAAGLRVLEVLDHEARTSPQARGSPKVLR